ncbi:AAA family ATPase [Gorillibacterium sp. sgz5001074]|uniref:AAA family ATPase n=1 Tax=Gorillibacterium sp. sgz5001074 TaxID=3446695 RepID=UPI003F667ADA
MLEPATNGKPYTTLGDTLGRMQEDGFTGREFELQYFGRMLTSGSGDSGGSGSETILNVHGIGGIGKSTLLRRFRRRAEREGALFLPVDLRDCWGSAEQFCRELELALLEGAAGSSDEISLPMPEALASDSGPRHDSAEARRMEALLLALNRTASRRKVVLALDQYEEVGALDQWLRENCLPRLHAGILIVIAGRYPLGRPWMLSPVWRRLIVSLPLEGLSYAEAGQYLRGQGITAQPQIDSIWLESMGHPLSLGLLASLSPAEIILDARRRETLEELLHTWLEEARDGELRTLLYAASVPKTFDQDMLAAVLDGSLTEGAFERLLALSFVSRSPKGRRLHSLVRDIVRQALKERLPDTFGLYRKRTVEVLESRIRNGSPGGAGRMVQEVTELLALTGNPVLRAHFRHSRASENYWETVTPETVHEAEHYIAERRSRAQTVRIACADPDSGTAFRYTLTAEESVLRLTGWSVRELAAFGGDVLRLLRSPSGEAIGLAAMLPIRRDTLPYLQAAPLSKAFFRSRSSAELEALLTGEGPPGRFILAADVRQLDRMELRSDLVHLTMDLALAGTLLLASPPPLPYYTDSHRSLGYDPVPGAEHFAYGGAVPALTYRLDTRQGRWLDFLAKVTGGGLAAVPCAEPDLRASGPPAAGLWTPREQEVAALLVKGATNAEIAASLYISVAAVKKHINAMLGKSGLKNRTQLAAMVLEES